MSDKDCFLVEARVFNWFRLKNEIRERNLETGVLTIKEFFHGREVLVEVKNGSAKVFVDDGILPRLEARLRQ